MGMKCLRTGVAGGLFATAYAFGCLSPALAETPADTLVYGTSLAQVISLDPHQGQDATSLEIMANLYDRLITSDANGVISPQLAERWEADADGITFYLNDATFNSTGNPVTASDVVWSIRRVLKLDQAPSSKLAQAGYTAENIDGLTEVIDDKTFRIGLTGEVAADFLLYRLAEVAASVLEEEQLMAQEVDGDMGNEWLRTNATGSGPFDLQRWAPNDIVIMTADDDHWSGAPILERVVMRHVPESQAARLLLEQGDIDIAGFLAPNDITYFSAQDGVDIMSIPTGGFFALSMNVSEDKPYSNPLVRQALFYAIDYEGIEEAIMGPYGTQRLLPVPLSYEGALPDPDWSYDPERARQLLAEAGYPDGFETTIKAIAQTPRTELATALQANLADIGIEAQVILGAGADIVPDHRARDFDLLIPRTGAYMPNAMGAMEQFSNNPDNSLQANNSGNFVWRSAWDIPELTALTARTLRENDPERRVEMYGEMQQAFMDAVPGILPMFERFQPLAISTRVNGYLGHPQQVTRLDRVSKTD